MAHPMTIWHDVTEKAADAMARVLVASHLFPFSLPGTSVDNTEAKCLIEQIAVFRKFSVIFDLSIAQDRMAGHDNNYHYYE